MQKKNPFALALGKSSVCAQGVCWITGRLPRFRARPKSSSGPALSLPKPAFAQRPVVGKFESAATAAHSTWGAASLRGAAVLLGAVLGLTAQHICAVESTWEYAVQVSAAVQTSPPRITLSWPQDTVAVPASYTVYRKAPGASSWGAGLPLPGTATSFADSGVLVGGAYEYQIVKAAAGYTGYGYICAGLQAPFTEQRGKVILVVDNTHAANLAAELSRLQQDLAGDGWTVIRHDVGRGDLVITVKSLIKADYNADPANVKSVFLLGHMPVPYSGLLNPDGHPDHYGAWPADVFYGDMDGNWTDSSVNYQQTKNTDPADAARLSNVPGDGKFDQTTLPSAVELQVGRVDLANMPGRLVWDGDPSFPSELELLRQYLNKDHNFRHKLINPRRRGVVGDYFGSRSGQAFAASGYRNFAPFFGADHIDNLNQIYNGAQGVWISTLHTNDYLWAYGCGAGSYLTIGGLGSIPPYNDVSTTDIVANDAQAVFTLMFGSWLGDWDHEDNILRSVLATKTCGLTAAWSGRPHWFAHHMGLGETIGYTARLTQNNAGLYQNQVNPSANQIHVALMGDPTLRMHVVAPPASLIGTTNRASIELSWNPSPDAALGYYVYRSADRLGPFARLTRSPVTATRYVDPSPPAGTIHYMVRAVTLEETPSGSYTNASQGIFLSLGSPPALGLPVVSVDVSTGQIPADGTGPATLTFTRSGNPDSTLGIHYALGGTAVKGLDYRATDGDPAETIVIPAGAGAATLSIVALSSSSLQGSKTIVLTLSPDSAYAIGSPDRATITIVGGDPRPPAMPTVTVVASDPIVTIGTSDNGAFTFNRTGSTASELTVNYSLGGTAIKWNDYRRPEGDMPVSVTIPAGASSLTLNIMGVANQTAANPQTVVLTLDADAAYAAGASDTATVNITSASAPRASIARVAGTLRITWTSLPGRTYRVAFKRSLADPSWTDLSADIPAGGASTSFTDTASSATGQRYYVVYERN